MHLFGPRTCVAQVSDVCQLTSDTSTDSLKSVLVDRIARQPTTFLHGYVRAWLQPILPSRVLIPSGGVPCLAMSRVCDATAQADVAGSREVALGLYVGGQAAAAKQVLLLANDAHVTVPWHSSITDCTRRSCPATHWLPFDSLPGC